MRAIKALLLLIFALVGTGVVFGQIGLPPHGQPVSIVLPVSAVNGAGHSTQSLDVPASGYLNWDVIRGTSGYGLRDNAGQMQFKDSGGAWTAFTGALTNYWTRSGTVVTPVTAGDLINAGSGAFEVGTTPATAGDARFASGFSLNARNAGNTTDGTILATDAIDQTILSGSSISLVNNAVYPLGLSTFGLVVVVGVEDQYAGLFVLSGANGVSTLLSDPASSFSNAAGTGTRYNLYYSVGNSRYELENKRGVTRSVRIIKIGY